MTPPEQRASGRSRGDTHFRPIRLRRMSCLLLAFAGWCAAHGSGLSITWQLSDAKGAGLEDAVVSLHPLDQPVPALDSAGTAAPAAEVFQKDRIFVPYVTVIRAGQSVLFPNRDSVQHHVYSLAKSKRFEIPLYGSEEAKLVTFEQSGVVPLGCNIHDWMQCYIIVLPTPFFAQTNADGMAAINGLTPGRYRSEVWHPRLAQIVVKEIDLVADNIPSIQTPVLRLKPDRRVRLAPDGRYP